jgi:hypothetical protein
MNKDRRLFNKFLQTELGQEVRASFENCPDNTAVLLNVFVSTRGFHEKQPELSWCKDVSVVPEKYIWVPPKEFPEVYNNIKGLKNVTEDGILLSAFTGILKARDYQRHLHYYKVIVYISNQHHIPYFSVIDDERYNKEIYAEQKALKIVQEYDMKLESLEKKLETSQKYIESLENRLEASQKQLEASQKQLEASQKYIEALEKKLDNLTSENMLYKYKEL